MLGSTGDYSGALEKIELLIDQLEAAQIAPRYLSMAYDVYGDLLRDLNLLAEAEAAHSRGMEIAIEAQVHFWSPRLQANLAIDRLRQGDLTVENDLLTALTAVAKAGAVYHETRCLEGLAELYLALGQNRAALEHADYLMAAATPGNLRELIAQAYRWQGEAYLALDERDQAEAALTAAAQLAQEIRRVRLIWDVNGALARFYQQYDDRAAAETHQKIAKETVAEIAAALTAEKWLKGLTYA